MNWQWLEVCVDVAGPEAEALVCSLEPFGCGRPVIEQSEARCCVKLYLPWSSSLAATAEEINRVLEERFPNLWAQARPLKEEDWANAWKVFFTPVAVGERLLVKPPWAGAEGGDRVVVDIDPGLAFGTGQHPSTQLCLRALEAHLRPGMAVLDLGAGSGILAIAAAKLGAGRVVALDIDPMAVKAARQNICLNQAETCITVRLGGLETCAESFDLILANISSQAILEMASGLAGAARRGGVLIASGFTAETVDGVMKELTEVGYHLQEVAAQEEWRAVVARKG